ncbi:MAG TPA: TorF family putative porin, partial [Candidatus Binatia bacterium]|nr:TorF family putative porin [Candidatus Binatia bacterium]
MKLEYGKVCLGAATVALSTAMILGPAQWASAGAYGEDEETSEAPAAAPASKAEAEVEEEEDEFLGFIPGTVSGSVTLISDYSFRGVSQTQRDFALQGGVTWKPWSGLYVGAWGSSINFAAVNPPDGCETTPKGCDTEDTYLEQDFFAGW